MLFWQGEDYDVCSNEPDNCKHTDAKGEPYESSEPNTCYNHTGSHHMVAVAWHAFVMLEFKDRFPEFDDRYKPAPTRVELDEALAGFDVPKPGDYQWWIEHVMPEKLSWISQKTGEKQPVCICDDGQRAEQDGDLARHYLIIHGIEL